MDNIQIREDIKHYVNTLGGIVEKAIKEHKKSVVINLPIENVDVKSVIMFDYLADKKQAKLDKNNIK